MNNSGVLSTATSTSNVKHGLHLPTLQQESQKSTRIKKTSSYKQSLYHWAFHQQRSSKCVCTILILLPLYPFILFGILNYYSILSLPAIDNSGDHHRRLHDILMFRRGIVDSQHQMTTATTTTPDNKQQLRQQQGTAKTYQKILNDGLSSAVPYKQQRKRNFPVMISLNPSYYINNQYRFIGDDFEKLIDGDTSPDYGDITYHPISTTTSSNTTTTKSVFVFERTIQVNYTEIDEKYRNEFLTKIDHDILDQYDNKEDLQDISQDCQEPSWTNLKFLSCNQIHEATIIERPLSNTMGTHISYKDGQQDYSVKYLR
jgi:hypothetical protein